MIGMQAAALHVSGSSALHCSEPLEGMQDGNQAETNNEAEYVHGQRTCVVCYGDDDGGRLENTTHMVMMDSRGYPVDRLQLPCFSGRIPTSPAALASLSEDTRKTDDVAKIVKFLSKHWPHLIVVGACSPECKQLLADLEKVVDVDFTQVCLVALRFNVHARPVDRRYGKSQAVAMQTVLWI
jgi:hypothetical protein